MYLPTSLKTQTFRIQEQRPQTEDSNEKHYVVTWPPEEGVNAWIEGIFAVIQLALKMQL